MPAGGPQPSDPRPSLLVLTSTFPRWAGDREPRFVFDLCRYLARDYRVHVLAPHAAGTAPQEVLEGVHVTRFRYCFSRLESLAYEGGVLARLKHNPWRALLVPLFLAGEWLALRRALRARHYLAIHAHWIIPQGLVAVTGVLGLRQPPPILCTAHGGDLHALRGGVLNAVKGWVLRRCTALTVVSEAMRAPAQALGMASSRIRVQPMGSDLRETFRPAAGVSRRAGQLLCVGRLVEKKGVRFLIDALALLTPRYPQLRLLIAGSGPEQPALAGQAVALRLGGRVQFLGNLSHPQLARLYNESAIAVFPFVVAADGDQEGLGLVVVEAQGCGCPVIASRLPAVRDTVEDGVTGLLCRPGDPADLAAQITRLLEDPALGRRLGEQARRVALERFDWRGVADRYASVLEGLAGHASQH